MKNLLITPLVHWGMGAVIIGVFAVVCVIMAAVIYNMANSKNDSDDTDE